MMSPLGCNRRIGTALLLVAAFAVGLAGCGNPESLAAIPTAVPAALPSAAVASGVSASVKIVPAQQADLAFLLSATVKDVSVAEGQVVHAGDALIVLDTPELSYGVTAAQEALKSAEADEFIQSQGRRKWDGFKYVWLSGPPEQRQLAHAHTVQAQAQLDDAEAELAQATLRAPFDGTVVSIGVSQGELAQPGETVLTIANLNHLRAETTDLSERDIARVQLGEHAHFES